MVLGGSFGKFLQFAAAGIYNGQRVRPQSAARAAYATGKPVSNHATKPPADRAETTKQDAPPPTAITARWSLPRCVNDRMREGPLRVAVMTTLQVAMAPKPEPVYTSASVPSEASHSASGDPAEGEWVYSPKEPERHKAGFYPPALSA